MDICAEIQLVVDALQKLNITATYGNLDKLLGCLQHLATISEEAKKNQDELKRLKDEVALLKRAENN